MLPLAHPQVPPQGGVRPAVVRRRERRRVRAPRAPSASAVRPEVPGQYRPLQGQTDRIRRAPAPALAPVPPQRRGTGWGAPSSRGLFASRRNTHCALWFSMALSDDPPLRVDAFAHEPWPKKLLYAFPPLCLILPLLGRVRRERLSIILVTPDHVGAPWYSEMTQMKVGQPWALPQVWERSLRRQVQSGHYPLWANLSRLGS